MYRYIAIQLALPHATCLTLQDTQIYGNKIQYPVNIMDTMDFAQLFDDDRMGPDESEKAGDRESK